MKISVFLFHSNLLYFPLFPFEEGSKEVISKQKQS